MIFSKPNAYMCHFLRLFPNPPLSIGWGVRALTGCVGHCFIICGNVCHRPSDWCVATVA